MPTYPTLATFLTALALSSSPATAQTWSSRPEILPARQALAATTVGDLALFAGGDDDTQRSDVVNIYDSSTGTWTVSALSERRALLAATSVGSTAIFAGGLLLSFEPTDTVDLYDAQTGTWTSTTLTQTRIAPAATSVGGYALIAGGQADPSPGTASDVVDVYDSSTGMWSLAALSVPRRDLAATAVGPYALFAGGNHMGAPYESVVDVYDSTVGPPSDPAAWSQAALSEGRIWMAATTAGPRAYFAGGLDSTFQTSAVVDVYDSCIGPPSDPAAWSTEYLSVPRFNISATSDGETALFAGGSNGSSPSAVVDLFDGASGTWSTESLAAARTNLAATSVGNQALFAGGFIGAGLYGSVDIRTAEENHWYVERFAAAPGDGSPEAPFPTIQAAVNAAAAGDTVHVAPGTYAEATLLIDRDLTIRGTCGRDDTVITASGSVVVVASGLTVTLAGLSIRNGHSGSFGGGLRCLGGGSVTVEDCWFDNNSAEVGGGIGVEYNSDLDLTIRSSRFSANRALYYPGLGNINFLGGGAVYMFGSGTLLIRDCEFINNEASEDYGSGGAVQTFGPTRIENSLFVGNHATPTWGEAVFAIGGGVVVNCTFVDNGVGRSAWADSITNSIAWHTAGFAGLFHGTTSYCVVTSSVAGPGNTDLDPRFRDPLNGDFRLMRGSPAIDAGDNGAVGATVFTDLAGRRRFRDDVRTPDMGIGGAPVVDMGAYELQASPETYRRGF